MLIQGQYKFIFVFSHLLALFWISQTSIQNAVTDIFKTTNVCVSSLEMPLPVRVWCWVHILWKLNLSNCLWVYQYQKFPMCILLAWNWTCKGACTSALKPPMVIQSIGPGCCSSEVRPQENKLGLQDHNSLHSSASLLLNVGEPRHPNYNPHKHQLNGWFLSLPTLSNHGKKSEGSH